MGPIGLGDDCPADEYDGYVPGVLALLRSAATSERELVAHLVGIETQTMCIEREPAGAERTARALLGLREACGRVPDRLVTQLVAPDGRRCVWVFRRPDGLYTFEHAMLERDADENGSWAWWTRAGDGAAGLFPSAEAALQDARSTIGWIRLDAGESEA